MGTRPAADDVEGAHAHPWFVGPGDHGPAGLAADIVVCASVPLMAVATVTHDSPLSDGIGIVAIAAVAGAALHFRTRWPLAVLVVALLGAVSALLGGHASPALGLACEIALFTVACVRPRRVAGPAGLVTAAVLFGAARSGVGGPMTASATLIVVVWTALAFAGGVAVRTQQAYMTALAERARRSDENHEQEARTLVAEERVRIARELHDVVAHHIAVINVHAGLARRAVGRDAGTVDTSLGHVQEAARTVLDELGTVLNVLRSSEETEAGSQPTTQPAPGLERLDELLDTFAGAGLEVRTTANWPLGDMDRACDLAAFRIIQESLTNASKHGADGQAKLTLISAADGLTIGVSNLVRMDPARSSSAIPTPVGHGLMGMRERAAACGGSLSARQDDQGMFSVLATIPHRPTRAPEVSTTGEFPGRHRGRARREGTA